LSVSDITVISPIVASYINKEVKEIFYFVFTNIFQSASYCRLDKVLQKRTFENNRRKLFLQADVLPVTQLIASKHLTDLKNTVVNQG